MCYVVSWFHHFLVKAFPRPFKNLSMCLKRCTDETWQKGHFKNNHTDTLNHFGVFMLSQMQQLLVFFATYISGLTGRDATERPRGNLSAMAQRTHLTTEDEKRRSIRHIHERLGVSAKRQCFVQKHFPNDVTHAVDARNPAVIDTDIYDRLHWILWLVNCIVSAGVERVSYIINNYIICTYFAYCIIFTFHRCEWGENPVMLW